MKNQSGIVTPIVLEIEDNRKFGHIAFLVDREDFLTDIFEARGKLKLTKLLDYSEIESWTANFYHEAVKRYKIKPKLTPHGNTFVQMPADSFDIIVEELFKKYRRAAYFSQVIESAILSGKVTNYEVRKTAYCTIHAPEEGFDKVGDWPELAIVVSPDTSFQEVEDLFRREVPQLFKEYKNLFGYLPSDTISNIKRDRDWYWKHKNGMSYQKIWESTPISLRPSSRDGIIKAIKQYKARLNVEL